MIHKATQWIVREREKPPRGYCPKQAIIAFGLTLPLDPVFLPPSILLHLHRNNKSMHYLIYHKRESEKVRVQMLKESCYRLSLSLPCSYFDSSSCIASDMTSPHIEFCIDDSSIFCIWGSSSDRESRLPIKQSATKHIA